MKRSIIYLALGFIALGCTNLELVDNNSQRGQFPDEYLAYSDSETLTKVFVNTSLKTLWNADDRITIFNDTYNAQWKFNGETGSDNGSFSKVSDEYYTAADIPTTYAVYPYNPSTSITTEGNITLTLPAVQHYAQNSYGPGANTMVAATKTPTSNALYFKSLCSFVVIQLYGSGTVKSITLTGNNGEKLAGTATVKPVYGEAPSVSMSDAATTSITLDCGEGVALGSTSATATEFWFCIPPTTFSKGFTIKAVRTDGYFMEKVTSSEKVFERNTKYAMAAIEGVFDQEPEYVPFEDTNFKAFCVQNFDTDGDGEISMEEALVVTEMNIKEYRGPSQKTDYYDIVSKIITLKDLEFFQKLREFYFSCSGYDASYGNIGSSLYEIDFSKNTELESLSIHNTSLTSLDVSKNTALTYLNCGGNKLTSLDVSKNTALIHLGCEKNPLKSLDVSKNTALKELQCSSNQLTSLDVSKNTALVDLECFDNQLTSLDVGKNTALTKLDCGWNQLTSLDVSKNTALTGLDCSGNQLTCLDVSKNTALTGLLCFKNQLTSLDISDCIALTHLECDGNQISTIYVWEGFDPSKLVIWKDSSASFVVKTDYVPFEDANFKAYCVQNFDKDGDGEISMEEAEKVERIEVDGGAVESLKGIEYFTKLEYLNCSLKWSSGRTGNDGKMHYYDSNGNEVFSQLASLDVSKNTALTYLYCRDNQITSLDVSKNTALTDLNCSNNQLTSLDVSNCTALIYLICNDNQLTSLDVSKNTALTGLYCSNNQLTSLDVSKNTALTGLEFGGNQLTSLDVSKNTALTYLYCSDNQLTSLDVSKNTALTSLGCSDNQLTSLDVSNNTALTSLGCSDNQLTSLDVSKNTALIGLSCDSNQLTSLDVSKNTALTTLECYGNQISTIYVWEGFDPSRLSIYKDDSASFVVKTEE